MKRLLRRELAEQRYGGIWACGDHPWTRPTRGFVVLVDADDGDLIATRAYRAQNNGVGGCVVAAHGKEFNALHRQILGSSSPDEETIFRNRNRLDCRRRNLDIATHSEVILHRQPEKRSAFRKSAPG